MTDSDLDRCVACSGIGLKAAKRAYYAPQVTRIPVGATATGLDDKVCDLPVTGGCEKGPLGSS